MTAEIVNLKRVKKRRAREAADQVADQARARHGRTKAQREADEAAACAAARVLDNARVDASDQS